MPTLYNLRRIRCQRRNAFFIKADPRQCAQWSLPISNETGEKRGTDKPPVVETMGAVIMVLLSNFENKLYTNTSKTKIIARIMTAPWSATTVVYNSVFLAIVKEDRGLQNPSHEFLRDNWALKTSYTLFCTAGTSHFAFSRVSPPDRCRRSAPSLV